MFSVQLRVTEDIGVALQINTCQLRLALKALHEIKNLLYDYCLICSLLIVIAHCSS